MRQMRKVVYLNLWKHLRSKQRIKHQNSLTDNDKAREVIKYTQLLNHNRRLDQTLSTPRLKLVNMDNMLYSKTVNIPSVKVKQRAVAVVAFKFRLFIGSSFKPANSLLDWWENKLQTMSLVSSNTSASLKTHKHLFLHLTLKASQYNLSVCHVNRFSKCCWGTVV